MFQGKRVSLNFPLVITAVRNEFYQGFGKGKGNRCRRYVHSSDAAALSHVRMGLENVMNWINTLNFQNFTNHVGVTPQCYICKYVATNASKGVLCPCCLFSMIL